MEQPPYSVMPVEWASAREALRVVRYKVFVEEQGVPEELEWDEEDDRSAHALAVAPDGSPIGTGRLLRDGHIGRMAVLEKWRRRGVGSALLTLLLRMAGESGHQIVGLHAQTHAQGFYARHGFAVDGGEFMEAGIPHVMMKKSLPAGRQRETLERSR